MSFALAVTSFTLRAKASSFDRFRDTMSRFNEAYFELSKNTIDRFRKSIASIIVKALRTQIKVKKGGYESVGYAFGNLYKSIKSSGRLKQSIEKANSSRFLFDFKIDMEEYGLVLDTGLKSGTFPPPDKMAEWAKKKKLLNSWYVNKGSSIPKDYDEVGWILAVSMFKRGRKVLLPNWYDFKKNSDLQKEFMKLFKAKKSYFNGLIKKDVEKSFSRAGLKKYKK